MTHVLLSERSLRAPDRKGGEGKGRELEGKGSIQDQVSTLTVGAPLLALVWGIR
jgi:hypothetical protein